MKILSFGEILWDVIDGDEHLGGAPFNFAAHIAQCGNDSFIVSRLGSDFLGIRAFNKSKTYDVDVSFIEWDEIYPTGIVDVTLSGGQPDYTIRQHVAYDFITAAGALPLIKAQPFDVFYFGSLAQRNSVSASALQQLLTHGRFEHVFYDVNVRKTGFSEPIIRASLKQCTIFKLNSDEVSILAEMLTGEQLTNESFCRFIAGEFPNIRIVIITASEKGCFLYMDNTFHYIPGNPVDVTDAVGAGDAFSASFMHVYGHTHDAINAARTANKVGAFVATKAGAIPQYTIAIKELLNENVNVGSGPGNKIM